MSGLGVFYILCLAFCGWQMVSVTVLDDLNRSVNDQPPYRRRKRGGSTLVRAILTGIGVAVAFFSGFAWLEEGAQLNEVLGAALIVAGLSFVSCLAVREMGDEGRRNGDPERTGRLRSAMCFVESCFDPLLYI